MPNAVDHALRISELVAARFAHELVGAAGAIANGLELMEELGADAGPDAAQLVNQSAGNLKARLQFYRMAYGRAGRESAGLPELRALTVGFFEHVDGVSLDWPMAPVAPTLAGGEGKLILNLAALAADAALDAPRALITAAPRCWTVLRKSPCSHCSSPIASTAGRPSICAL